MPETPLPARPDFDFFAAQDVTTDRLMAEVDEVHQAYQGVLLDLCTLLDVDFLTTPGLDIMPLVKERFTEMNAQLETARHAYHAAYQTLITDNPWRVAAVRDSLRAIGAALGVE